jgi:polysaccharide pyruvyl transferase WcaK-like protein
VRVAVTRRWKQDVNCAERLKDELSKRSAASELLIPENLHELEECLASSRVVVSMNLHGLILAWRSGVPVVAISDAEKTRAFMEQSCRLESMAGLRKILCGALLEQKVTKAVEMGFDDRVRAELARQVETGFSTGLEAVLAGVGKNI